MESIPRTPSRALGVRVRELRLEAGLSQHDLAQLAALHPSNIGRIERGAVNPSLETLAHLARGLDCSVSDLTAYVRAPAPTLGSARLAAS